MTDRSAYWAVLRRPPLGLAGVCVALVCIFLIAGVDKPLILWALDRVTPQTYALFSVITDAGNATGYVIITLAFMLWWRHRIMTGAPPIPLQRRILGSWYLLLTLAATGLFHHALKIVIGRYRPRYLVGEDLYGLSPFNFHTNMNGFPSGHTQTAFAIATCLFLLYPRLWPVYFGAAILVGMSRIALGAHYLGDVVFGAYVGIAGAVLMHRYYLKPRLQRLENGYR
ncbi:MAG: phosphatase PAP2 family protein [Magnetospiraceae bacterium]